MEKNSIRNLVLAALFAALITVCTAWLFHIPIPIGSNTAYLHFGDTFIFLAATLLPTPYACTAATVGGGLADLLCGAAIWVPFTAVIKALIAFCFTSRSKRMPGSRNLLALIPALFITVGGYYLAEAILYGNWYAPLFSIWGNVVQTVGSGVLYVLAALALQKAGVKKLLGE